MKNTNSIIHTDRRMPPPPDNPQAIVTAFITAGAGLAGALIGGLTSYFSTRAIERRKWAQQRRDKFDDMRREAIHHALTWLTPIETGLTAIWSLTHGYLGGSTSEDILRKEWPDLLQRVSDPPAHLQVLLPPEAYKRSFAIIRRAESLKSKLLFLTPGTMEGPSYTAQQYKDVRDEPDELIAEAAKLRKFLIEEHRRTFEATKL